MKEALLAMLFFGAVVIALINIQPKEVVKEVVKEVPTVVVKEVPKLVVKERVAVKKIFKEPRIVYETVNHYHNDRNVVYYQLPEQPRIQQIGYSYYEPVKEREVKHEKHEEKPKVKMFLVEGIREPLWVEGGKDD